MEYSETEILVEVVIIFIETYVDLTRVNDRGKKICLMQLPFWDLY